MARKSSKLKLLAFFGSRIKCSAHNWPISLSRLIYAEAAPQGMGQIPSTIRGKAPNPNASPSSATSDSPRLFTTVFSSLPSSLGTCPRAFHIPAAYTKRAFNRIQPRGPVLPVSTKSLIVSHHLYLYRICTLCLCLDPLATSRVLLSISDSTDFPLRSSPALPILTTYDLSNVGPNTRHTPGLPTSCHDPSLESGTVNRGHIHCPRRDYNIPPKPPSPTTHHQTVGTMFCLRRFVPPYHASPISPSDSLANPS